MRILVNHLTRMGPGFICVAGLRDTGEHVRPVLDNAQRLGAGLLAHNGGPFELGAWVELSAARPNGRTPEVEDHLFDPDSTVKVLEPDQEDLWSRIRDDAELSLVDIFGHDLERRGKKAFVPEGMGRVSLGTLASGYRPRLKAFDGQVQLTLYDPRFDELHLRVTDARFFRETTRGWELSVERIEQVAKDLQSDRPSLLSVGLTRPFAGSRKQPVHWLQVNNIHLEPDPRHQSPSNPATSKPTAEIRPEPSHVHQGPPGPTEPGNRELSPDTPGVNAPNQRANPVSPTGSPSRTGLARGLMAKRRHMWPSHLPAGAPRSEQAIWQALGDLPEEWRVIHGVRWQALRHGVQGDGEADFVLLHPERGLLVIEAKGGGIRVEGGVWHTEGKHGTAPIDPVEQAQSSKRALLRYLRETIDELPWMAIGHAVWFPDVKVEGDLGPAAPADIILDRNDLSEPMEAIRRICDHWEMNVGLTQSQVDAITHRLAPTVDIRITLADRLREIEDQQIQLTDEQARALDGLRHARRVLVVGGAGTGKTVLAIERAKLLSSSDYRVALVCFNRPLGKYLERTFDGDTDVDAGHFHALAHRWVRQAGLDWPTDPDDTWWDDPVAELVLDATDDLPRRYDAVIVDEGQDFAPSWFLAMEGVLRDPAVGQMVIFADRHQAIYRRSWEPPYDSIRYDLDRNVRNTRPIAGVVAGVVGDPPPQTGADGPDVGFVTLDQSTGLAKLIGRIVHRLVREESVDPEELVVLFQRKGDLDVVLGSKLAGLPTRRLEEPGRGVVVESIHRFKGMESLVAIVALRDLDTLYDRALAYIGMSRAKAQLTVLGPEAVLSDLSAQAPR